MVYNLIPFKIHDKTALIQPVNDFSCENFFIVNVFHGTISWKHHVINSLVQNQKSIK